MVRHPEKLDSCEPALKQLVQAVGAITNVLVVYGHRGQAEQDKAYAEGKSKLKWPNSKHNSDPSHAVDLAPCDSKGNIDWNNARAFILLATTVKSCAKELGINIIWGGDWKSFKDLPHYELG